MTKPDDPQQASQTDEMTAALRDGFSSYYIDPHDFVSDVVNSLRTNMDKYCNASGSEYIAPYTSLITSSMMGKSRLMKQLSTQLPLVYVCLRNAKSSGYPIRTPNVPEWIRGGLKRLLGDNVMDLDDVRNDRDFYIPTVRFSLFLLAFLQEFTRFIQDDAIGLGLNYKQKDNFQWMWEFFAEPSEHMDAPRTAFWETVTSKADQMFKDKRKPDKKNWAQRFFKDPWYEEAIKLAYRNLEKELGKYSSEKFTLVFCFDEARILCRTSAVEGGEEENEVAESKTDTEYGPVAFSNFRALRRALNFMSLAKTVIFSEPRKPSSDIPRVFALFTDTTSVLNNFQPQSAHDPSARDRILRNVGKKQFDPLYIFTSIDAHARTIRNSNSILDPAKVANAERLLKFGRAGWYSLFSGKDHQSQPYDVRLLLGIAQDKLLGKTNIETLNSGLQEGAGRKLRENTRLSLLAVLAARLAIPVGPYSVEAAELVSSHLAVLIKTDEDRHFLRVGYPSEPIVAEAAAQTTLRAGWAPLIRALYHYLQNGVVSAGYRGELLTKVLCLMAMDDTTRLELPLPTCLGQSRPVKVRDFLDNLLAAPHGFESFSAALNDKDLQTDRTERERFLNGYVFFNHFIRLEGPLSIQKVVFAWNRGAAIMPKENTEAFDHVIPVMLVPENGRFPTFGSMFQDWSQDQIKKACSYLSLIMINSKNEVHAKNKNTDGMHIIPNESNMKDSRFFAGSDPVRTRDDGTPKSVFLSILQGFGPKLQSEQYVNILNRGTRSRRLDGLSPQSPGWQQFLQTIDITELNRETKNLLEEFSKIVPELPLSRNPPPELSKYRQIVVVLKGLGVETYKCLQAESPATSVQTDEDAHMAEAWSEEEDELEDEGDGVGSARGSDPALAETLPGIRGQIASASDGGRKLAPTSGDVGELKPDRTEAAEYLEKLKQAHLDYLEDVSNDKHKAGIVDFFPAVFDDEFKTDSVAEWKKATKEKETFERARKRKRGATTK